MTVIEQIENCIVERLKPLEALPDFDVVALPENHKDFERPTIQGRITVAYEMSDFDQGRSGAVPALSAGNVVQENEMHFHIAVQARKLRGERGIYDLITKVKKLLLGFQPGGADPMKLVKIGMADTREQAFVEGLWTWVLIFRTVVPEIEEIPEDNDPLLKTTAFDEEFTAENFIFNDQ